MRFLVLPAVLFASLSLVCCTSDDKTKEGDEITEYETAKPGDGTARDGPVVHTVEIVQMKFVPEVVNIKSGDTVVWVNRDIVQHDVTGINGSVWTSSPMAAGASWKRLFDKSQQYHCSLHVVMRGKVIVDGKDIALVDATSDITMCDSKIASLEDTPKGVY